MLLQSGLSFVCTCNILMNHISWSFYIDNTENILYLKFFLRLFVLFDVKCHVKEAAISFDPRVLASEKKNPKVNYFSCNAGDAN